MAPFATIFSYPNNFRVQRAHALAALGGLELVDAPDFSIGTSNRTPEFLAKFPLGKVPVLETSDGFCLSEGQAICRFIAESGSKADQLVGSDVKTRARIEEWSCFADQELTANLIPPLLMTLFKMIPYDEARYNQHASSVERAVKRVQVALESGNGKFLVGEQITLADIMVAGSLVLAGRFLMDAEMVKSVPKVKEYLDGLFEIEEVKKAFGGLQICEQRLRN
ncbi:glutathione S-transferase [Cercophora newfieldiana]|uniref:Glutathione S-transferase n=1 Tax=Cercophora newfieldiana TaxID=92897 RepID=A0AA39YBR2_9PEZI|nr:glutathione S-transferase [Cercophora newfieldiana]